MGITRRELLAATALGIPSSFLPTASYAQAGVEPRMRLEDFVQNPGKLAALKKGVATMKSRLPSDPTSWFFQGAVHAVSDDDIRDALARDPNVAQVAQGRFWNQCPHNGEGSAEFLIWHRAYIYYFERILRDAAGDPTFSLPYWNYTDPKQRAFPRQFANPETDNATGLPRNSLYDHRRELAFTFGLYELSEGTSGTQAIFAETDFFGATEADGFAGGLGDSDPNTKGAIEAQPHDVLHFAIGGAIGTGQVADGQSASGIMANVQTAAFDPIFWVHHANIDRLWTVWDCLPNRVWGLSPPKAWLEAKPWSFYDADKTVKGETRLFYLDRRNLKVAYDSDAPACKPLSATDPAKKIKPGPGVTPMTVPSGIKSFAFKGEVGRIEATVHVGPDDATTTPVPLTTLPALGGQTAKTVITTASTKSPRRLILEIGGLTIEGVTSVGFDVYVNPPATPDVSRTDSSYVGTVSLFGFNHHHAGHAGHTSSMTQRFDITRAALAPGFDEAKLAVRIKPFDLLTPVGDTPRLRRPVGLSYSSLRIVVVEGSDNAII